MRPVDSTPTVSYQIKHGSGETGVASAGYTAEMLDEIAPSPWPHVKGYELLSVIGSGGMGIVYKARHRTLQRTVALKMLYGGGVSDPDFRERIQAEAEAVAKLQHPNIIQVFEIGTVEPVPGEYRPSPFISLEFVDGGSLSKRISVPQSPQYAAEIVEKLARAAHAAHRLGVVHRDLKPANVLMTADGEPKIADFGVAKQIGPEREADGRFLTQPGIAVGTPEYMAPEQVSGAVPTPAIDVYALGMILYEMLTARVPFHSTSAADTMLLVLQQEVVSPRRFQPGVPGDLETICLKCLQKAPGKRYESAEALADDLARWREGRPILARPVGVVERSARWVRRNPVIAGLTACVVLVALMGVAGVVWKWREARSHATAADLAAHEAEISAAEARGFARAERWEHYRANIVASSSALRLHNVRAARRALDAAPEEHRNWEWDYFSHRLDASLVTHRGPDSFVHHAFLSANGTRAAMVSNDDTLRIWDVANGREYRAYHDRDFTRMTLSPDGTMLAYPPFAAGNTAVVWDIDRNRVISTLRGHEKGINGIRFAPDGRRLVTGAGDHTARMWDIATGKELFVMRGHKHDVCTMVFTRDGKRLVTSASTERSARVWNAETGELIAAIDDHDQDVADAVFTPDGRRVVTIEVFPSNVLRLWDAATGHLIAKLPGHKNQVKHLAFSPDGKRMASSSHDQTIRVWDSETGKPLYVLRDHNGWANSAAFSPDGAHLVTTSEDNTVRVWDAASGESCGILHGHTNTVYTADYTADGSAIVSASADGTVRVWDAKTHERGVFKGHTSFVYGVAFHPDSERVASVAWDGTVRISHATTGRELQRFKHADHEIISSVAFHPNGELVASLGRDNAVHLWDLATGKEAHRWQVPTHHWQDCRLAFSKDGERLAAGGVDGKVRVFDVKSRAEVAVFGAHKDPVRDVAFSPDGRWLASGGGFMDHTIRIWDLENNSLKCEFPDHEERVYALAFSSDGKWLASGSYDGTVRFWDVKSWTCSAVLRPGSNIHSVAFTPDSARLAAACVDNTIRFWDVATMQEVAELRGHTDYVHAIAFSPDGTRLVSGSGDHTVRIWDTIPYQKRVLKR